MKDVSPRLLRYTASVTRDWSLAEEVSQDVLMVLVQRWRRFGPPDSVEAFVFSIARRRAARAGWRRRLMLPLDSVGVLSGGDVSQLDRVEARESLRRALGFLSKLSRKEVEAITLVALAELSVRQAAHVLGVGESAMKMRVLRARQKLKKCMENQHGPKDAGSRAESCLPDPPGLG